jgi:murein L,D-transpeptidase YcbB/YkuD
MKNHFKTLLKGIFLGSVSSLVTSNGADALTYDLDKLKVNNDGQTEVKTQKDNSQKFILKFQSDDSYLIAGHRSHASHASHASHRSSSTYSGSSTGTSSSNYSTPTSTKTVNTSTQSNTPSTSLGIINLGDRILKKGMDGNDVIQLKEILVEKKFLPETFKNESMLFDEKIELAVIEFQKSVGLRADGIVGSKTVYLLKN